jgi:hypothetical protein
MTLYVEDKADAAVITARLLADASGILNKPKSVPFLTQEGTVAELRFGSPVLAAECRNDPGAAMRRHDFVKMLTSENETAAALLKGNEQ